MRVVTEFTAGDDVMCCKQDGSTCQVGRLMEDGTRSKPLVRLVVEEDADEEAT